jgi:hypothetical protein
MSRGPEPVCRDQRFWSRVIVRHGCWGWRGYRCPEGRGRLSVKIDGRWKTMRASRISWEVHYGIIPGGLCVCHTCDNPECTNPAHLFLGTPADNTLDMCRKGRRFEGRGTDFRRSMINDDAVREIRLLLSSKSISCAALARRFSVTETAIRKVRDRKTWAHVA